MGIRRERSAGGIGEIRLFREPEPLENPVVGTLNHGIVPIQAGGIRMERIKILHEEFPAPEDAGLGPQFVAELRLDLVAPEGKVAVAADELLDERHDDLLVRGIERVFLLIGRRNMKEGIEVFLLPTTRLHPVLARGERGHQNLLRPDGVHLLAHDLLDILEYSEPQREERVHAGHRLVNEARPRQKLGIDALRIGSGIFGSFGEELGEEHRVTERSHSTPKHPVSTTLPIFLMEKEISKEGMESRKEKVSKVLKVMKVMYDMNRISIPLLSLPALPSLPSFYLSLPS